MKVSESLAKDIDNAGLRLDNFILRAQAEIDKLTATRNALIAQASKEVGAPDTHTHFDTETREFSDPKGKAPLSVAKSRQVRRAEKRKAVTAPQAQDACAIPMVPSVRAARR